MISSTGSASACSLPATTDSNNQPSATNDESSTSFSDVMQQHESTPHNQTQTSPPKTPSSTTKPATIATTTASTTESTTAASDSTDTPADPATKAPEQPALPAGSDLASMIIQAAVLASSVQAPPAATPVPVTAAPTPATPGKTTPPPTTDLATLITQAASLILGSTQPTTAKTPTTTSAATTVPASTSDKDSETDTASTSAPTTLSMAIVQAAILGSGQPTSTVNAGKDLSATTAGKGSTSSSTKEKKSTTPEAEGSFLQSGTATMATTLNTLSLLGSLAGATGNTSVNPTFTPATGSKNSAASALSAMTTSTAGTANVEKDSVMNSTMNPSSDALLSATGANTPAPTKQPDLQIQLASNHDFADAMKQVMHVAQITQTAESRTPMRVEMTIQTPPGAVVNIYVSNTNGQLRAQLGTNDPQALAWVQTQVTSLRQSNDLGVNVTWLPPQMEGNTAIATSSSQDPNLSWNQGGGQSNYQQPDERPQQPDNTEDEENNPFMSTLTTAGRSA